MDSNRQKQVVGVFSTREDAGQALDHLIISGFPLSQIFLVSASAADESPVPNSIQICELLHRTPLQTIVSSRKSLVRALLIGKLAGGITGLLLGVGVAMLPGVGQVILGSAIAYPLLVSGMGTAAGGLIGAALNLDMTENQAKQYSELATQGNCILIVTGTEAEIFCAEHILYDRGIRQRKLS